MITTPNMFAALRDRVNAGIFDLVGSGAPTNGTSGSGAGFAGMGSFYTDTVTGNCYINLGTMASPTWYLDTDTGLTLHATGTISAANITGTSAGQFGHANGVVLVAAPGANLALQLISASTYYTFATAAYTAGGNTTVNWGAGGAALTGLVSAANSFGAASSKALQYFTLTTAAVAIVSNASLNLVSSAAFTQPGTAAGTIAWEIFYRILNVGF